MNKKQKTPLLQKQGFTSFMGSVLAILCGLAVGFIAVSYTHLSFLPFYCSAYVYHSSVFACFLNFMA